jgi:hypothetical protein
MHSPISSTNRRPNWRPIITLAGVLLAGAAVAADKPLTLMVLDPLAAKNACSCVEGFAQRDYDKLAEHLSRTLKRPVTPYFNTCLPEKAAFDLAIGRQSVIEHEARANGTKIQRIARLTAPDGSTSFHGLFIVRSNDTAQVLSDLKDRRLVFGTAECEESHAAAIAALQKAGIPVPKEPAIRDTNTEAGIAVAESEADAAAISDFSLRLMVGCKAIGAGELRVIGQTADVPFIALYATDHFPESLRAALVEALQGVAKDKGLLNKMESAKGFVIESDAATRP